MNETPGKEQRLLRNARREGLVILAVWAAALLWSCIGSYSLGYRRAATEMSRVLGMPDWVFWCIAVPWLVCFAFSAWFCFGFMADDDLGQDPDEDGHDA
jgi:hypothetical protein